MNSGETVIAVIGPLPAWARFLIMTGALLVGVVAVLIWVLLSRGKPPRHHHRKRRRNFHEPRKANPTLAETGGLPPPRVSGNPPAEPPTT